MKFLFRSNDGMCLSQALRVKAEGNKVRLSIKNREHDWAGDGLIEKSTDFGSDCDWADIIIYDPKDEQDAEEAEKLRGKKPVLGASALSARLEHDREFGINLARQVGINCKEVESFKGPAAFIKAVDYLKSKPRDIDWVLKTNGKKPNGVGTFVSKDGRLGALRMLRHWEDLYEMESIKPDFILTSKVNGAEISTEAWFNGKDFYLPNHTIERTKFFPGDVGEKVGCAGNVVWPVNKDAPLYRKLIAPLGQELVDKFVGPIDVNVIIDEKNNEPTFLEFSPRFGYDAIFALMELFDSEFGRFLAEVATGSPAFPEIFNGFAGDVRISIPPFPAKAAHEGNGGEACGVPIFGVAPKEFGFHVHPIEVMSDENNELVTSGPHGCVLAVSARGDDVQSAQKAAYRAVDKIHIPNMRYRNDLEQVIVDIYEDVEATGYLTTALKPEPQQLLRIFSQRSMRP